MARAPRKGARSPDRACAFEPNSVDKNDSERGRLNYRGRLIIHWKSLEDWFRTHINASKPHFVSIDITLTLDVDLQLAGT